MKKASWIANIYCILLLCMFIVGMGFCIGAFCLKDEKEVAEKDSTPYTFSEAVECVKRATSPTTLPDNIVYMESFRSGSYYYFQISYGAQTVYYCSGSVLPINQLIYSNAKAQAQGQILADNLYTGGSASFYTHVYSNQEIEKIIAAVEGESWR